MKRSLWAGRIALLWTAVMSFMPAKVSAARGSCDQALVQQIPAREAGAPDAASFLRSVMPLDDDARETAIRAAYLSGNVPDFLRELRPVHLSDASRNIDLVVCVMPDYLALGSDRDYLLTPVRLATALAVAQRYGFVLPTSRIVDAVYQQAEVQLSPQPLPAGPQMRSTAYYERHNRMVLTQRAANGAPAGELTAGDKKDLVITGRLWRFAERVAIYGWHRRDGRPIQPLSTVHGERYADYSHGLRLVSATAYVNGQPRRLLDLLQDPRLAPLLSDEGAIPRLSELVAALAARHPVQAVSQLSLGLWPPGS